MPDFTYTHERQFKGPGEWQFIGTLEQAIVRYRARFGCDPVSHTERGNALCFPLPQPEPATEQLTLFGGAS